MSSTGAVAHDGISPLRRFGRSRSARVVAATMAAGLTVGVIATSGGGGAGAATTYSTTATGRFLSGTIAGLNLDTVAGIEGESAANKYGPTVTNKNSLVAEVLNKAIELPLQDGLQLPGLNILQLGAVSQYAQASPDGSALGASGAVDSNGGIGVGGSDGAPTGTATLDLSGLGGADLAKLLNVKATIGAISARAKQAAAGGKQSGEYNIASADLELDVPIIANLLPTVLGPVTDLLDTLSTDLNSTLGGLVTIPKLGDAITSLETVSLPSSGAGAGAISLDLTTGTIKVSVEKLLQSLGLDLNNLPANTELVPYIVKALAGLPAALGNLATDVITKITDVIGGIKVAGISAGIVTSTVNGLLNTLGLTQIESTLTSTLTGVVDQLKPITDLLSSLLDIVVNGQSTSKGVFTETAIQLKLGGALSGLNDTVASLIKTLDGLLGGLAPDSLHVVKLASAVKPLAAARPAAQVHAAAVADDPLIQLNLAQASAGPSTPKSSAPSSTPPASSSSTPAGSTPATGVPTGVPAGQGAKGGSPTLPLVLVLLTLGLAAGGVGLYRFRGARGSH